MTNNATVKATTTSPESNGVQQPLHGIFHAVQPEPLPWYKRIFQWEDLIVAGKEVKGFVIHPIFASAIVGLIVTLGLSFRSELSWQHDQLITLSTQKNDAEARAKQEHDDRALQESADRAWREKMTNQMAELRLQLIKGGTQ